MRVFALGIIFGIIISIDIGGIIYYFIERK